MYLLMLLATFMSAIYGYNLSARPEFDRDIPHKKALAVQFKFTHQHRAVKKVALNAMGKAYEDTLGVLWLLPGTLLYTDAVAANQDRQALILKQQGFEHSILVRPSRNDVGDVSGSRILHTGRTLFPANIMTSQILCPSKEIDEDDVEPECEPTTDEDGYITKTCCGEAQSYLVSYRILDARWLNRLTNQVNADFLWAVSEKEYAENIGVITWDEHKASWIFTGKIKLYAVYRKDKEEYMRTHDAGDTYPVSRMNHSQWVLPNKVFTRDFFKYMDGNTLKNNLCDNGCLVKIEEL